MPFTSKKETWAVFLKSLAHNTRFKLACLAMGQKLILNFSWTEDLNYVATVE